MVVSGSFHSPASCEKSNQFLETDACQFVHGCKSALALSQLLLKANEVY